MPLTRDFKATIQARAARDLEFRAALYSEALDALLQGDIDTAKSMLRDYVNATIGFERLEAVTGTPRKSLMRMLSAQGNPRLESLGPILRALNGEADVKPQVRVA
ncbi:MAG: transcriptional regulator [Alphaproteobacteria bacterium]|nr:transcriptional regulator [Alphaproteobacteria bacterium]